MRSLLLSLLTVAIALGAGAPTAAAEDARRTLPDLLVITVDTLRQDRLGAYGYLRPTTPALDELLAGGARFDQAYTPEPLTAPAMISLWTGLPPHQHGATRNGLRMKPRLLSLPRILADGGYHTAAFVGTWTLRDKLTGLGEHFQRYEEVLNRRRWFGLFRSEATAEDLTSAALDWLRGERQREPRRPLLLWVHYVEPHAPYRLQEGAARELGIPLSDAVSRSDRYDSEVRFVDDAVGRLRAGWQAADSRHDTVTVFLADHGESLGEHAAWGHGRDLFQPTLLIPLGITWPERIGAGQAISAPAVLTDLAPSLLGMLGLRPPASWSGFDWTAALLAGAPPPADRTLLFQAHRGAVLNASGSAEKRERGLLEVGRLVAGRKEVLRLATRNRALFDLALDPRELRSLVAATSQPSAELAAWLAELVKSLHTLPDQPAALDPESAGQLKALGYLD